MEKIEKLLSYHMLSNLSFGDDNLISLIEKMDISSKNKMSNQRFLDISHHLQEVRESLMNKFNNDEDMVNSMVEMIASEIIKNKNIPSNSLKKRNRKQ
jgi:hypothetical protein